MKFTTLALAAMLAVSVTAQAAPIQSASATFTGTLTDFNDFHGYLLPQEDAGNLMTNLNLGNGISLTSSQPSVVGQDAFDLDQNGLWTVMGNSNRDGNFVSSFAANNGQFTFNFSAPVQKVGIFANQSQLTGENNSLLVLAYGINGNVLESFSSTIDTDVDGNDEGMFIGFERASADIYGFGLANGSFVVDNLLVTAVPEPETYAMLLIGLGAIGAIARRRRA